MKGSYKNPLTKKRNIMSTINFFLKYFLYFIKFPNCLDKTTVKKSIFFNEHKT